MIRKTLSILRKTLLVGLTPAAVGVLAAGLISFATPLAASVYAEKQTGAYLGLRVRDGGLLVIWCGVTGDPPAPPVLLSRLPFGLFSVATVPRSFATYEVKNTSGSPLEYDVHFGSTGPTLRAGTHRRVHVAVHSVILFAVLAAYPTIAFIRGPLRRYRRRRRGLCITCGYDLTGNESGVCPECGTKI